MQDYKYGELTSAIIASSMEVHNTLRSGFQEFIYQRALEIEFRTKNIPATREVEMPVYYKGIDIGSRRVDFLVNGKICLELKAIGKLEDVHLAQALNYLEAFNLESVS